MRQRIGPSVTFIYEATGAFRFRCIRAKGLRLRPLNKRGEEGRLNGFIKSLPIPLYQSKEIIERLGRFLRCFGLN